MITSNPFGFISYNTREFLQRVLQTFVNDGMFLRCACWYHESTGTEKNHFHCWVEPAKQIDTFTIVEHFVETDEDGKEQSIAIRPKCKSKFIDAYLYGIHDLEYLTYKGLIREEVNIKSDNHIYIGDFKADLVQAETYRLKNCLAPFSRLKILVEQGKSLEDIYVILRTPFAQLIAVSHAYNNIKNVLYREKQIEKIAESYDLVVEPNTNSPFETESQLLVDTETGEVIGKENNG